MATTGHQSVDDYIAAQPAPARRTLERVRSTIRKALPRATEGISYRIPVYKVDGVMVVYFAGFRRHYSIYPATERVVRALRKELAGALHSKATIRFPLADAVPTRLITRIVKVRAAEVAAARTGKKVAARKAKPRRKQVGRRARKR